MNSDIAAPTLPQSLDSLISELSEEAKPCYPEILRETQLPISAFEHFCSWSPDKYTRNCIVENEKFELLLLCWEPGQLTPIHNHGGEECWVKVIKGDLKETIYQVDSNSQLCEAKSTISRTNEVSYMVDFMGVHRLENISDQRSMSLHLYAKPIRNCKVFDHESKCFINKEMNYNTVSPCVTTEER